MTSNHAGGILGGISTGMDIVVRAAVKPIPSISRPQNTVDSEGKPAIITVKGRHDISAIPRIVPVLEAMTLLLSEILRCIRKISAKDFTQSSHLSPDCLIQPPFVLFGLAGVKTGERTE